MPSTQKVQALSTFRVARSVENAGICFEELSSRIDNCAHLHVSTGAVVLLRQILRLYQQGDSSLSYTFLCARIRVSRCTLSRYIDELETAELLKVRRSRQGKQNAVNQFEIDFSGPLGEQMVQLKTPRNPSKKGGIKSELPDEGVVSKVNGNIYIHNDRRVLTKVNRRPAQSFANVEQALEATTSRSKAKREAKAAVANTPKARVTLAGVKATWAVAMLKAHPSVPAVTLTTKDMAVFKQRLAPILAICNLSEFFTWVIDAWPSLRATKFNWLRAQGKDVAPAPSIPELMRYWKVFSQAFADSRLIAETPSVSREEELGQELAAARRDVALVNEELRKTRERASTAERIAYAPKRRRVQTESLSAKEARLADLGDDSIPDWE